MAMKKVFFPKKAPWAEGLVRELLTFPVGANDDQVDVLSLFGRMLNQMIAGAEERPGPTVESRNPTLDEMWKLQKWDGPIGRESRRI